PLTLIGLVGVYVLFRRSRFQGIGWLTFFGFITYILSSWWNWYYGGSFSSRAYLEYLFIFFIPLGLLIDKGIQLSGIKRLLGISTLVVFTALCQFQTYQYRRMVIHWDQMNKTWYWDVFLSTDFTPRNPDDYRITP
ncbi:MAG: hypothetical protein KDC76_12010, partial [Bacteroidetes bacterium]|nr:hypothetical protein [Bacteroidota bacterium]